MKKYCDQCGKEADTQIITKKEIYNVCGEQIEVNAQVLICSECKEELFCEELDNTTLINAYNEYRKKHKLLLPTEIKQIREQYDLSQRSFSKLLNWGDKTLFRYENGSIQDKAHNSILLFLRDPENMKTYLSENEVNLSEKQIEKLLKTIAQLQENNNSYKNNKIINMYFSSAPSEENGYKVFDYDKCCGMVLFFANKSDELLKTKLMKLLNYSDMLFYKKYGISISGLKYIHLPYGPVPDNFEALLSNMQVDHLAHIEITYDKGYEKHQIVSECATPIDIFSKDEQDILNDVYNKFKSFSSSEISEYSHKEKGYISTNQGETISYAYAKDINMD